MASAVIEESTAGTVDRRRTEEWLRDIVDIGDELPAPVPEIEIGKRVVNAPRLNLAHVRPT